MYSYPLSDFTAQALKNILFSLYSKGLLLSKAVNGQFFVPQELCDRIYDTSMKEKIVNAMKNTPDLVGIEIRDDQLVFTGFLGNYYPSGIIAEEHVTSEASEQQEETQLTSVELQEHSEQSETPATQQTPETQTVQAAPATSEVQAISVFLDYFINHCKTVNYIQLVSPETDNERYTMRGWFNQLGWKGIEDRPLRTYFYERLSGHTAFKTEENKRKWLEARKAEKEQRNNSNSQSIDEQQFAECEQPEEPEDDQPAEFESCSAAPECGQTAQSENVEAASECEQPEGEQPAEQTECEHLEQETEQVENTEPATGM